MRASEFITELVKLDEVPLPPDWDPEQLNLRQTFKNRLKYALDRAKKLGGGSSRVAMTIDYEGRPTVLKVAKNLKGLAQNEAEIAVLKDGYLGRLPIVIPMIDHDKANARPVWLQTELAKPISAKRLTQLLHCPEILDFIKLTELILDWGTNTTIPKLKEKFKQFNLSEKDWDICNEYASELAALINDSEVLLNDLINHRNWGEYNSRPVIIDLGYTQSTKRLYGAWTS